MMKVTAISRSLQGTSASRRLRNAGHVPGIVYGGKGAPTAVQMEHNPLWHALRVEAFHASILDLEIDGKSEQVLLRNVQMHAFKQQVQHIDFQRVSADQKIHMKVPFHFVNQELSPAVKIAAGIVSHILNDIQISCLPKDLPSFIEVDLATLEAGKPLHVKDVNFPAGVTPVLRMKENPVLVTVSTPGGAEEEPAAATAAAAPAKGAAPAKAAAAPAKDKK
jgi:large subunit ribosomal protein L25